MFTNFDNYSSSSRKITVILEITGHNHYYLNLYGDIIVELKAVSELQKIHEAQVINYLKATGFEVGLLFNFGSESLEKKRFFNIYHNSI